MLKTIFIYLLSLVFFLAVLPAGLVAGGLGLDRLLGSSPMVYQPYNLILALIVSAHGTFWMLWSLYVLIKIGKGNPQEGFGIEFLPPPRKLVIIGPYRYTRNPMGFGWFSIMVGIGIYLGSTSMLLIVLPVSVILVILYLKYFEERKLVKRFGEDYLRYQKEVPTIVPTVPY